MQAHGVRHLQLQAFAREGFAPPPESKELKKYNTQSACQKPGQCEHRRFPRFLGIHTTSNPKTFMPCRSWKQHIFPIITGRLPNYVHALASDR